MNKENSFAVLAAIFVLVVVGCVPLIMPYWFSWMTSSFPSSSPEQFGQFGDMFGIANSLFSGLAFAGLIYTILLQHKELQLQRDELAMTREELRRSAGAQEASATAQEALLKAQAAQTEAAAMSANITAIGALLEMQRARRDRLEGTPDLDETGHRDMTQLIERIHKLEGRLDVYYEHLVKHPR